MGTTDDHQMIASQPGKGYVLSGKIMLTAIVVLFAVVLFMVALHLYARWYLLRSRRRQAERRRQRRVSRSQLLTIPNARQVVADTGLEIGVLNSLPVFLYSSKAEPPGECAVCLSEFEEKEILRLLPKCNHSFHIECIDIWFHSHSTCPLCRSTVEKVVKPAEMGCSSGSGDTCQHKDSGNFNPPPPPVRKGDLELRIEVPQSLVENESSQSSPASRLLALKRILSMGRAARGAGTSCEWDLESGMGESRAVRLGSTSEETAA